MPTILIKFLEQLTDEELESILDWIESPTPFEDIAQWIYDNRPELARNLFVSDND